MLENSKRLVACNTASAVDLNLPVQITIFPFRIFSFIKQIILASRLVLCGLRLFDLYFNALKLLAIVFVKTRMNALVYFALNVSVVGINNYDFHILSGR